MVLFEKEFTSWIVASGGIYLQPLWWRWIVSQWNNFLTASDWPEQSLIFDDSFTEYHDIFDGLLTIIKLSPPASHPFNSSERSSSCGSLHIFGNYSNLMVWIYLIILRLQGILDWKKRLEDMACIYFGHTMGFDEICTKKRWLNHECHCIQWNMTTIYDMGSIRRSDNQGSTYIGL